MVWIFIVLSVIAGFFLWLLIAPIILVINTQQSRYFLGLAGIASATLKPEDWSFHIKVPFYSFRVDPWKPKGRTKKISPGKKTVKKSKRKSSLGFKKGIAMARDLWNSFKVRVFRLDVDTGDYAANAQLVPVMYFLSRGPARLSTNYRGVCRLHLEIENRLIRMIRPLIKHLIFT